MSQQKARRVLVAMDGSSHSNGTFRWYVDNMKHDNDIVLLVWNVDPHPASFGTVNLMTGDPDVISKILHEQKIHIEETLKIMQQKLDNAEVKGRVIEVYGNKAGESIIRTATQEAADLIVVGSRGLSTIRRTFLGSVSDYVLHHAHVPVVICKENTVH